MQSVEERQRHFKNLIEKDSPGVLEDETIFDCGRIDPETYSRSCEALIGQVAIPVGIVGPLDLHYREYEEDEAGGEGAALSGMIGVSCNPANVIAAILAATGQDLACVGTSSMAVASSTECPQGLHITLRLPNLEVGTVGGGAGLPHQSRYLEVMQCKGKSPRLPSCS